VRPRTSLALLAVLVALCALAAAAPAALAHGRLDTSFGSSGTATVTLPKTEERIGGFQIAPEGRVCLLLASTLLAFEKDGEVAAGFGEDGRVSIAPAVGEGETTGLAVDSQGRLLVTGSTHQAGQKDTEVFVIRLMPDGSRDPSFGSDGEVDTDFGLPAVPGQAPNAAASSIVVDQADRPIIGGSFEKEGEPCGFDLTRGSEAPFVARLTTAGALDGGFAGTGRATFKSSGGVSSLAEIPGGGSAVFTVPCSTPPRFESRAPLYSVLTESGEPSPLATERGIYFSYAAPKIDPRGRVLELESPPPAAEGPDALTRYRPNGELDPSFGHKGTVVFRRGYREADAFAVDSHGRPIVAVESSGIALMRFLPNGKVDKRFGHRGRLTTKGVNPSEITLDPQGRIYTVSVIHKSSRATVAITRFIPGA
jgi:uncharacterized delta-60 repeat protein